MAHIHETKDAETHFIINATSREISNSDELPALVQNDHNSERFTFVVPRFVDGHDMSRCNKPRVHYLNIDSATKKQYADVYEVDDLHIDETDETKVVCTWLISRYATQYAGSLNFIIQYACENNGVIDYAWNTAIFKGITVKNGINNAEQILTEYADILEKWQDRIEAVEKLTRVVDSLPTENISTSAIYLVPLSGNLIAASVDENEEIYNGKGYRENVSYSVGFAEDVETDGTFLTGHIPIETGDLFLLKNIEFNRNNADCKIFVYKDLNFTALSISGDDLASNYNAKWDDSGNLISVEFPNIGTYKYMRIQAAHIDETSSVTVNKKDGNSYAEYVYVNGEWEQISGSSGGGLTAQQAADLSNNTRARHTHGNKTVSVPADEVSYTHKNIQDTSGTVKGALDEAIDYVTGTVSQSLHVHSNKTVLDNLSDKDGNLQYKNKPIASESSGASANPRAIMAQTVILLLENSETYVSIEPPEVASTEESDFANLMFNVFSGHSLLYAPSEDGELTYLDAVTYEPITIHVSAGGVYEFYLDVDTYELKRNSYFGEGVLAFFKSKLLAN